MPKFPDEDWYLEQVKLLFLHGNTKKDIDEKFYNCTLDLNKLIATAVTETDFQSQERFHQRTLLEKLVLAPFSELKMIYERIVGSEKDLFMEQQVLDDKKGMTWNIKQEWKSLYNAYDKFVSRKKNIDLIERYGIKCCPYCNENFVFNRNNHSGAQLDHFYPRSEFPIFAISLYNLVPSCTTCNHIKSDNDISLSPHDHARNFNHMKISYRPLCSDYIHNPDSIEMSFEFDENDDEYKSDLLDNIQKMGIEGAYNQHKDYVWEILQKAQMYDSAARQSLAQDFPDLFSNDDEMLQTLFGNYISEIDFLKRPLSKLTRDLLIEVGILQE